MLTKSFNSRRGLKEKIVQLYIGIIKKEEPWKNNRYFWEEFFLLKANGNALEQEIKKLENISDVKVACNLLFARSIIAIGDANQLCVLNGLITICSLSYYVLHVSKPAGTTQDELIDLLIGKDEFASKFDEFLERLLELLQNNDTIHDGIKRIVLKLLLIFASADINIKQNAFLDKLISDQMFDSLLHLLHQQHRPQQPDGNNILLLLVIFLNYNKDSKNNPYVMKLSIIDNEMVLSGYSQVISSELFEFNQKFSRICADSRSGIFSTLSSMMGTIFSSEDSSVDLAAVMGKKTSFYRIKTALLAFYHAVLLNRNFISLLTTTISETFPLIRREDICAISSASSLSLSSSPPPPPTPPTPSSLSSPDYATYTFLPADLSPNLLVAFLEFTSVVLLDTKDESTLQISRLCFIILTCITEDACANSILHDNNMAFVVNIQRMPMRHRKVACTKAKGPRPLTHAILDLMNEFILSHMNRHIPFDLFSLCLGITHRLLCFQKRCRIRIDYCWKECWYALICFIKFAIGNESHFVGKHRLDVFTLCHQAINIFNMFIMCGDAFLATTAQYDDLYYEIMRTHVVFDNLNLLALRHMAKENNNNNNNDGDTGSSSSGSCFKESATRLTRSMMNIKAIIAHLNGKIDAFSAANQIVTLSEEQVLQVVRANYDSLTLKIPENVEQIDQYDPMRESELHFFAETLASIVADYVTMCRGKASTIGADEQHTLIASIQCQNSILNNTQMAPTSSVVSVTPPATETTAT